MNKLKILEVEIVEVNKKGNGVGFFVSQTGSLSSIEVPFSVPQDLVRVSVIKERKKAKGVIEEILKPSPLRVEPRCRHFGDCGGCRFQNVSYLEQLKFKEADIASCFKSLLTGKEAIHPIIPCETSWNYRNKMEFSFSEDSKGNRFLGLIKDSSKGRVVSIEECHLVSPWFQEALEAVRQWWSSTDIKAFHPFKATGSLRTLTLREGIRTQDKMAILNVSGNPDYALSKSELECFSEAIKKTFKSSDQLSLKSVFLRIQQAAAGMETNFFEIHLFGADHIRETLKVSMDESSRPLNFSFHVSPTAFFQPNSFQAEKLYESALRMAGISKDDVVYDLYCGTGTLGIIAAKKAKKVIGIEISPESILDAKTNAELNGVDNIHFLTGAVRNVLSQIMQDASYPKPDIIMVDPPRPGLDPEAMRALIEVSPKKILYVSCNPHTQADNIKELIAHGYRIVSIQPIDQFPHTPHVENIVLLQKAVQ